LHLKPLKKNKQKPHLKDLLIIEKD